ncbi:hypothetical protein [Clavibacter michiganensis]|uniref:hypothetical protein n=1 Tax=Clavibacter michiganensis TaxID=28447 RepID=UPI0015E35CE7|nr:hypothetical protein [Clavibacter michiganensis]
MTDFERKTQTFQDRTTALHAELTATRKHLARANEKTAELLQIAAEAGVTAVSIGKKHPRVENEGWPFGYSGNIFTPVGERVGSWPAAWHIAERAGIGGGSGNTGQHQTDNTDLIDGVYELRAGQWARIDLDEVER